MLFLIAALLFIGTTHWLAGGYGMHTLPLGALLILLAVLLDTHPSTRGAAFVAAAIGVIGNSVIAITLANSPVNSFSLMIAAGTQVCMLIIGLPFIIVVTLLNVVSTSRDS
jgi:hypothetical protein